MIKLAMHLAKDEMKTDSLCINEIMDHNVEKLVAEHKFMHDATPFYYYIVNWSFGPERPIIENKDMGIIF